MNQFRKYVLTQATVVFGALVSMVVSAHFHSLLGVLASVYGGMVLFAVLPVWQEMLKDFKNAWNAPEPKQ